MSTNAFALKHIADLKQEVKSLRRIMGLVLIALGVILALLLTGCTSVYVPVAKVPANVIPPAAKKSSAPAIKQSSQLMQLSVAPPKLNPPRTLSLACDPVAGADRYGWAWGTNATTITATSWTSAAQVAITNLPHSGRLWLRVKAATGPYESAWCDPITFSAFATAWQMSSTGACKIAVNISGPWTAHTNYSETITNGYSTGSRFLKGMVATSSWKVTIP